MATAAKKRIPLGILFLIVAAALILPSARLLLFAFAPAHLGSPDSSIIEVRKGQSPQDIVKNLVASKIIDEGREFIWLGRLTRQWKRIKAGEYKLSAAMAPLQIFSVLTSGISVPHPVTVREGENMYEIAADLDAKRLAPKDKVLGLCRDPKYIATLGLRGPPSPTLEGYLFPDTYFFNRSMTPEEMLRQMTRHFEQIWGDKEDARAKELGLTRLQAVTLASIIEKETGSPAERPLISSVFHNRLHKKMRLQSDPTTIYGMWERYTGNIHRSDLQAANSYNTYHVPALPVGPIANPGREAIQAALYPAQSDFLFFVSHNDGTHEFTRSLADHTRAVAKFQLDPKAREGKSWRDLTKKLTKPATTQAAPTPR